MKIKALSFFNLFFTLFFCNSVFGLDSPNHSVKAKILFNEIYDINISEGNYKVSAELLLSWDGDINSFLKKQKWSLTITGTYNEYRYRLRLFQRFKLKTKIIGYDENWFYFFQKIERNEKTHMASVVKYAFTSKNGIVKPKEVVEAMGEPYDPTQLPSWVTEIGQHQVFKK